MAMRHTDTSVAEIIGGKADDAGSALCKELTRAVYAIAPT